MKKIQVLFPEPTMRRLRGVAEREDRPMSELIRRATEGWLEGLPENPLERGANVDPPTFDLGLKVSDPERLRELIYGDEEAE